VERPEPSPGCHSLPSPSPLHAENQTDDPIPFPGLPSSRITAGARVDGEGCRHRRPSLSAPSLHLSLPILDLNLTQPSIFSVSARGRCHHQWSPETIADEHDHPPLQDPLPAGFGRGRASRETAAALQQLLPPSTPLGEHPLAFPVARARVSPAPPSRGRRVPSTVDLVLIGRTASPRTASATRAADHRPPLVSNLNLPSCALVPELGWPSSDPAEPLQIQPV
jgi:hypothetical protein